MREQHGVVPSFVQGTVDLIGEPSRRQREATLQLVVTKVEILVGSVDLFGIVVGHCFSSVRNRQCRARGTQMTAYCPVSGNAESN
jgi:hypothetical protein